MHIQLPSTKRTETGIAVLFISVLFYLLISRYFISNYSCSLVFIFM